jgi:PAS domain-containing protein
VTTTDLRICFVSAPGTSVFTQELLGAIAQSVTESGLEASTTVGAFPELAEPCAYVVVPHEFFLNTSPELRPTPEQRARTIALCVEHPGTTSFEISAFHAASLGAVMDISGDSTAELRRRGLKAERFRLGYSESFDAWGGVANTLRPIDITYMGTTDIRRDALLARQADRLAEWECRLLIPPHEWMTRSRPDFLIGHDKLEHLAQSKVLINLHRGESRALEWVRAIEAMSNGCVIVSERSKEFEPLVPGRHILFARPENTVAVASALLRNPERLEAIRRNAYALCRTLDMRPSALRLVELARSLVSGPVRATSLGSVPGWQIVGAGSASNVAPVPTPASNLPELASWATTVPRPLRVMQAISLAASRPIASVIEVETHDDGEPGRVRAVLPVADDRDGGIGRTVRSLRAQDTKLSWSIGRWKRGETEYVTPSLPRRGPLINSLVCASTAEYILVLEPGQELFVEAVRRLLAALDANPSAAAAFGIMADTVRGQLWNALPLEPERLLWRAYLGSGFLVRRVVLSNIGEFSDDPALNGYEYHDFWCRLVESGFTAVLVAQVLGTGPTPHPPDLGIASIAPELAWEALRRGAPGLFGGRTNGNAAS